ncbi:MAG: diguanylate cyclase [Chromatiales bacterium]|nr:diguanylate cyclase [Chromatiales bacterium]
MTETQGRTSGGIASWLESSHPLVWAPAVLALAVAYYGLARLGLLAQVHTGGLSPLWPSAGLGFALIWCFGLRFVPVILIGEFAIAWSLGQPVLAGVIGGMAQLVEAGLATALLTRLKAAVPFEHPRDVLAFIVAGAAIPPVLSALIGVTTLVGLDLVAAQRFTAAAVTWWLGDAMGILIVAPLLVYLLGRDSRRCASWARVAVGIAVLGAGAVVMWSLPDTVAEQFFFLLTPLLIFVALYGGVAGAALAAVVLATVVLAHDYSAGNTGQIEAIVRISFIGVTAAVGYLLAVVTRERSDAQREFGDLQRRALITLRSLGEAVFVSDEHGRLAFVSSAAEALIGQPPERIVGQPIGSVLHFRSEVGVERWLGLREPQRIEHAQLIHHQGRHTPVRIQATPILDADGSGLGVVVVLHDRSRELALLDRLRYLAYHDTLTGLANRRAFHDRMRDLRVDKDSGMHALLYLDLDQFKFINDSMGHRVGDRVLREIAQSVATIVPAQALFARMGGDEFAILLPAAPEHDALSLAQRIRERVRDFRYVEEGRSIALGVSIGIATFGPDDSTQDVVARADNACYEAKSLKSTGICVARASAEHGSGTSGGLRWATELRAAISDQRLRTWLAPARPLFDPNGPDLFDLTPGLVYDGGVASADLLLSAAVRYGLRTMLDKWLLDQAFRQLAAGTDRERSFIVGIGVDLFLRDELLDTLDDLERHHAFDRRRLIIGLAAVDLERAGNPDRERFDRLHARGYRLLLDSPAPSWLRIVGGDTHWPFDFVRIESQWTELLTDPATRTQATHWLRGLCAGPGQCIATGVESKTTLDLLGGLGVGWALGAAAGKPVESRANVA